MSYAAIEKKLREIPEDHLAEVAAFLDFMLYRHRQNQMTGQTAEKDLSRYYGSLKSLGDGMLTQRRMRDEWT